MLIYHFQIRSTYCLDPSVFTVMPEESKKNPHKGKNEPKEQRRRKQGRQPAGPVEKKQEKQKEQDVEKKSKEPEKPTYEPPGPEFYKNLKRETDEILKITEEENSKYKKKEIKSNWAKYEMPVETYDEIDEHENMGVDYEKLIQGPASAGGHFQFKHEKSWDTETGPSLYDKYFDINMDILSLAVSTIPFYERNSLDQSMFDENDILTMNHRATKYKQKYYNDKKYNTPELLTQEKTLKILSSDENPKILKIEGSSDKSHFADLAPSEKLLDKKEILETVEPSRAENEDFDKEITSNSIPIKELIKETEQIEEIDVEAVGSKTILSFSNLEKDPILIRENECNDNEIMKKPDQFLKVAPLKETNVVKDAKLEVAKQVTMIKETPKNPVIESPEDLEKWLDDFLDS